MMATVFFSPRAIREFTFFLSNLLKIYFQLHKLLLKETNLGIKLLATIGPSSFNRSTINAMEANGVDLFKVNLSHTKISDLEEIIKSFMEVSRPS